jgi:hypothetical protein
MQTKEVVLLSIDAGCNSSGVAIIINGAIEKGMILSNEELFDLIDHYTIFGNGKVDLMVVYEDIRPFTSRFNMDTINTCKVIGRLEYVLKQRLVANKAITRNEVKSWVFRNYKEHIVDVIEKRIEATGKKNKNGENKKPSFHYVNDRLVYKAMRLHWDIDKAKVGRSNKYGLKSHSWSALAVATTYLHNEES